MQGLRYNSNTGSIRYRPSKQCVVFYPNRDSRVILTTYF